VGRAPDLAAGAGSQVADPSMAHGARPQGRRRPLAVLQDERARPVLRQQHGAEHGVGELEAPLQTCAHAPLLVFVNLGHLNLHESLLDAWA
jgi:hypothetical protein